MDIEKLKSILTTFADPATTVEISKGNLLVQINDKTHLARVRLQDGDVFIDDDTGETMPATRWLILRIAKLPLLAERILQFLPSTPQFVHPEATLFDNLDDERPSENEHVADALDCATRLLGRRFAFTSSVVYLTSDAGEGKTTLIHELARQQAAAYKDKRSDWLLVPIALGGRPFMRFDDMIAGYLTNKLRFPLFYYEAFIELVKLGVIIPAFDGFEETLVVNASGDAYSAIGNLMASLDQQGTVIISARKAFFDYQELKLQARLYDSIGKSSVAFSRIQLLRWKRPQFIRYASLRGHPTPDELFNAVSGALHTPEHALLTRAVLANRLLTVATNETDLSGLLSKLGSSPVDYFPVFVDTLIEREVVEKWLTSGGDAAQPLLSIQEHRELLSMIAQEMWIQATETLKVDILELIASLFCEANKKASAITQQVQQRIKQHALLVPGDAGKNQFGFDHEEFRHYFLGLAVAKLIAGPDPLKNSDLSALLRRGALPSQVLDAVHVAFKPRSSSEMQPIIDTLRQLSAFDSPTSYLHENCAHLIIRLLSHREMGGVTLESLTFGSDALSGAFFTDITFNRCTFHSTGTASSSLKHCRFVECIFDRLDLNSTPHLEVSASVFQDCEFNSIVAPGRDGAIFDPDAFAFVLKTAGFTVQDSKLPILTNDPASYVHDAEFITIEKLLRCFSTRTHITDLLVKTKFGKQSGHVLDQVIPRLIKAGVLYQDTYRGGGKQHLYKIGIGMLRLQETLERSRGSSADFFRLLNKDTQIPQGE